MRMVVERRGYFCTWPAVSQLQIDIQTYPVAAVSIMHQAAKFQDSREMFGWVIGDSANF